MYFNIVVIYLWLLPKSVSYYDFEINFVDDKYVVTGEREHATALYMACKHLPPQLLSSPGERNGMLTEAARTLEKIGDKRSVDECYKLMKSLGTSVHAA